MHKIKFLTAMRLLVLINLPELFTASAATYYVSPDGTDTFPGTEILPFRTIGKGMLAAANGDTVSVAWGEYMEIIAWTNKSVTVRGAGPDRSVIRPSAFGGDCHTLASVPTNASLEGFTLILGGSVCLRITGGSPTVSNCALTGSTNIAMLLQGSSPTVTNCAFTQNYVAMSVQGSHPTVKDSTFSNNGFGMRNDSASSLNLNRCAFSDNGYYGMLSLGGSAVLNNCIFINNGADGVVNNGGALTLNNCLFRDHNGTGAEYAFYNSTGNATLTHCTFSDNRWALFNGGVMNVANCIVWGNAIGIMNATTVAYSDVQGGFAGTGNINTNPLFVISSLDYHLTPGSPCINAGSAAIPGLPSTDLDGVPRILEGAPDMGAYESTAGSWFVDAAQGNDANAGSPQAPFRTLTKALNVATNGNGICIKAAKYGSDRPRITKSLHLLNWGGAGLARIGTP